jgi:HD-GYP domain-containing protein (c-di-GMP phosphodiesterase class II)
VALVLSAVALYLVSSALVDTAAGLTLGQNPFSGWWASHRRKLPHEGVLLSLGVFAAMPARDFPWVLPVLVVPAAIVRRSLQDGLNIKSEARETLESLAEAMDLRHHRAADHSRRVSELARAIARRIDLSSRDIELVTDAARLRDVGEVALAPDLLVSADLLTEEQRSEVREHSNIGARMVERFPDFADCAVLIRHHHERWDGWGAPDGLTGEAIPLGARIIAVAETYEALIASRPYREALSPTEARDELRALSGTQLDPKVVDVLLDMLGHETAAPARAGQFMPKSAVAGGGL